MLNSVRSLVFLPSFRKEIIRSCPLFLNEFNFYNSGYDYPRTSFIKPIYTTIVPMRGYLFQKVISGISVK